MVKEVSVVIPCLNEEKGVGICIRKIQEVFSQFEIDGEIIIVDNGCTDNTINVVNSFFDPRIRIIYQSVRGYGNAYREGFKYASGGIIVMGDADNSYDFYDIPRFLDALRENDFVIGNRSIIKNGSMPALHRYIGRPVFSVLMRGFFDLKISDSHCGFGAIKKEFLDGLNLKSSGMEFASEILIKAKKQGLKIAEIPIVYSPRLGNSKLRTFKDGARHLNLIIKEVLN